MNKPKLVRITTVPISLDKLLEGQLAFMSNQYEVIAVSSDGNGDLKKVAERENVTFHAIPLTRSITPIADLKSLWKMYKFLKKEKPEIVHSHTPKAGTIGMFAAKLAGVPIRLHTVAGLPLLEVKGMKRILLNVVEKITYAAATKVLPNSKGLKEIILAERFCQSKKLEVIGKGSSNGINTSFFNPEIYSSEFKSGLKEKLNINVDDFVYIFVGRIVRDKGIVELISAFNSLNQKNIKLILVGSFEHELDPLPTEILQEITLNPNIIHTGWQTDVRPYYAISDVLVFPSYREGFPNVVLQAGAMGLPSIVSDINGCNEIVTQKENGIIIPVKNSIELKKAMQVLFDDTNLYQQLKSNARSIISSKYERKYIWRKLEEMYKREYDVVFQKQL